MKFPNIIKWWKYAIFRIVSELFHLKYIS